MELIFTNKCKDKIVQAKDGLKFALKGYAFYSAELTCDAKQLLLSNIDTSKLILDSNKNSENIREKLFDLTFIPSLESSVIKSYEEGHEELLYKYGTYEIKLNKGLFNTLPQQVNYIFLFGEEYSETKTVVIDQKKSYLAASIKINEEITENYKPKKIAFQVGLSDITDAEEASGAKILVNETFDEVTENEYLKNLNLIEFADNFALTPDPKNNNNFIDDIKYIKYEYEDGPVNTKFFPGNITLFDESEKVNNPWNTSPRVYVGLDRTKNVTLPHTQFFYNKTGTNDLNSFSIQYSPDNRYLAINQDVGIDYVQADILPEDVEEENKHCIKDKIKRKNITFDFADTSACRSYFRYDSNQTKFGTGAYKVFECDNRGNELKSDLYTTDISLIYSDYNKLLGENSGALILDSDRNTIGNGINDLTVINTYDSSIVNKLREYNNDTVGKTTVFMNNNVLIGVTGLNSVIEDKLSGFNSNNITFIGNNTNSDYVPYSTDSMLEFDSIKSVNGVFKKYYNETSSLFVNDSVNTNISTTDSYSATQSVENQSLIGFGGLSVNKIPNKEVFYENQYQIGYDRNTKQYDLYYYGDTTAQTNTNYSVVFGQYNANENINAIGVLDKLSVNEIFSLKGKNGNYDNEFSSYLNKNFTYTTDENEIDTCSAYANIYKLYFKNTQDSIYATSGMSAEWNDIKADEGDFGLDKIVVVGNGKKLTQNVTGHSPAEFASNYYNYSKQCRRINLFSIEKNSLQLVHNGVYDDNPHYSATNVINIPSMFTVRGTDPVQDWSYHFVKKVKNNTTFIDKKLYKSINSYNLHHSVYTPTGIFIPLQRSSNDLYKLNFSNVKGLINNNIIKANKKLNYDAIENVKNFQQYTYVLPTKGLKIGKETKLEFDMKDLIDWYAQKNITIPMSNTEGTDTNLYTFYIINNNPITGLNIKGFRMRQVGNSYQTLYKKKYIPKGHCLRVDYMDCGTNGKYGVMNFNYWNQNTNSFYK